MTHRIRMARKRLMVARERLWSATMSLEGADAMNESDGVIMMLAGKQYRRKRTLRAIERRKEKTC
jgi:hypothetical protein